MNINQLGQKKKKQAVRRLSQSSPASQGNRKEDIRRKLEAKRLANLGRGAAHNYQRGRSTRNVYKSSHNQGYGRNTNPFKFERDSSQRHVSPLANTTEETISGFKPGQHDNAKRKIGKKETEFFGSPFQNIAPVSSETSTKEIPTSFDAFTATTKTPLEADNNVKTNTKEVKTFRSVFSTSMQPSGRVGISPLTGITNFTNPKDIAKTISVFEQKAAQDKPIVSTTEGDHTSFIKPVFTNQTSVFGEQTTSNTFTNIAQNKSENESLFGEQNAPATTFTNVTQSKPDTSGTFQTLKTQASAPQTVLQGSSNSIFGQQNTETNLFTNGTQSKSERIFQALNSQTSAPQTVFQAPSKSKFGQQNAVINPLSNVTQSKSNNSGTFQTLNEHSESIFGQGVSSSQAKSSESYLSSIFGGVGQNQSSISTPQPAIPTFTSQIGAQSTSTFSKLLSSGTVTNTSQRHAHATSAISNTPLLRSTVNPVTSSGIFGSMVQQQSTSSGQVFGGGQFIGQSTFPSLGEPGVQKTTFPSLGSSSLQTRKETESALAGKAGRILPRRERRVSTSSVDISQLTAVVIKGLTKEYLNKKVLTELLMRFGEIRKVLVQPTKEQAIVTFGNHESAREAKTNAKVLLPVENIGIYWYKKSRSSSGGTNSGQFKDLSESNKEELRLRQASIIKALKTMDISMFPVATSAKDRFTILDDVDIKIRQAIKPYNDLATAPTIIGVCPDMCPEKERYMREDRMNLSIFEIIPGTQDNRDGEVPQVDHARAVKEYSRSAADKLEPLAHEMRPLHVLQVTMDYLTSHVMDNGEGRLGEWFNFLWDRTRAIRKDITQQHLCDVEVAELVEKITRFHIFCAHFLCEEDMHSFDPKINNENLTKCLQTLKQIYEDLYRDKNVVCSNEAEFQAYDILLNLNEGDTLRKAMKYRCEVRNSPEVKFALQVFSSLNSNNYVRFFYLVKSSSYLNACIMHRYFAQVRSNALRTMTKAYRPQEQYPLENIKNILLFEDKEHAKEFCEFYGFSTTADSVQFSKMSFTEPENLYHSRKATNIIEIKRHCSIGEVVSGSPLKSFNAHVPYSSFDHDGRYIGLNHLCQLLGGDSVMRTKEPETPDYYSEHDGSLLISDNHHQGDVQPTVDVIDSGFLIQAIHSVGFDLLEEAITTSLPNVCQNAITEEQFKLKTSQQLTSQILNESISMSLREIASECLQQEIHKQREMSAIRESRHRVSGVILGEILKTVIQSELNIIAQITKKEMKRRENAQRFLRISSIIADDLMQQVVVQQCSDISQDSRRTAVKEKKKVLWKIAENVYKNKRTRYFKKWVKEFRTTLHIKDILVHMPPLPAILTPEEQVQKLFNKSFGDESYVATTSLAPSFKRKSCELENQLGKIAREQESKRLRAKQPINIMEAIHYSWNNQNDISQQYGTKTIKLVLSLHGYDSNQDGPTSTFENIIKNKFINEASVVNITIPASVKNKINVLSSYVLDTQSSMKDVHQLQVDIKSCSGILSETQLNTVKESNIFLGLTGVIFIIPSFNHDNMFWISTRTRLYQILRSKPCIPRLPLVILSTTNSNIRTRDNIETNLDLGNLKEDGLISEWIIFENLTLLDTDVFHDQMIDVLRWLFENSPCYLGMKSGNLKSLVENEVYKCFTVPFYEEMKLRTDALMPPQCPEVIIDLYNSVIQHLTSVITNKRLQNVSWPVPEFQPNQESVSWNSSTTFKYLQSFMSCIQLPQPPLAAKDGLWKTECSLCVDYITKLTSHRRFKQFQYPLLNRVTKMLQSKESRGSSPLTAADVPWPYVVQTCINMVLSWLHSVNDLPSGNILYFEKDLQSFIAPISWQSAVMQTTELASITKSKKKAKRKAPGSFGPDFDVDKFLTNTCLEISEQSEDDEKNGPFTDDIKSKTKYLDEELFMEKRDSQRFEEQLKQVLNDDFNVQESMIEQARKRKCDGSRMRENTTLDSSFRYFETTLVSFQHQIRLQKHIEELSEIQLEEALKSGP